LCKRIKTLGDKLLLCVHFSDTWADPGKQFIPVAWEGEDINGLEKEWEKHAYEIVKTLKDAGAMPDMIQIGNEITNGAAWPIARVQFPGTGQAPPFPGYDDAKQWDNLTRLLKAGVKGAKAAAGKSPLKIAIHIDQGGHWDKTKWFFDHVEAAKVPYDIIAQSCYPQYGHATPEELLDNMVQCSRNSWLSKPVIALAAPVAVVVAQSLREPLPLAAPQVLLDSLFQIDHGATAADFTSPVLKPSTNIRGRSPRVSALASSVLMVRRSPGIRAT
jgi:arabinogalactan endo-1,4-beta-galactosidase